MTEINQNVVVALDNSSVATTAALWGAKYAADRGKSLLLLTAYNLVTPIYAGMVMDSPRFQTLVREEGEQMLSRIATQVKTTVSITPELEVTEGHPVEVILTKSKQAELIVMGSRGLGNIAGIIRGSNSAAVVSHAVCPVVVLRENNTNVNTVNSGPVVVGYDGSNVSDAAIKIAFEEARLRKVKLIVVHTWLDLQIEMYRNLLVDSIAAIEAAHLAEINKYLTSFRKQYPEVNVEVKILQQSPETALITIAANAQLLVVGSHGRGGFAGMLLGSTSRKLLHSAPCPLMVVK